MNKTLENLFMTQEGISPGTIRVLKQETPTVTATKATPAIEENPDYTTTIPVDNVPEEPTDKISEISETVPLAEEPSVVVPAADPFSTEEPPTVAEQVDDNIGEGSLATPAIEENPIPNDDDDFWKIFNDDQTLQQGKDSPPDEPPASNEPPAPNDQKPNDEPLTKTEDETEKTISSLEIFQQLIQAQDTFEKQTLVQTLKLRMETEGTADNTYYYIAALINIGNLNEALKLISDGDNTPLSNEQGFDLSISLAHAFLNADRTKEALALEHILRDFPLAQNMEAYKSLKRRLETQPEQESPIPQEQERNLSEYQQVIRMADAEGIRNAAESGRLTEYLTPEKYMQLLKAYEIALTFLPKSYDENPAVLESIKKRIGDTEGSLAFLRGARVLVEPFNLDNIYRYWLKPGIAETLRSPVARELYVKLDDAGKALVDKLAAATKLQTKFSPADKKIRVAPEDTKTYKARYAIGETYASVRDRVNSIGRRNEVPASQNKPPETAPPAPGEIPLLTGTGGPGSRSNPPNGATESRGNFFTRTWDRVRNRQPKTESVPPAAPRSEQAPAPGTTTEEARRIYSAFLKDLDSLESQRFDNDNVQQFVNKPGNTDRLLRTYQAVIDLFSGVPGNRVIDLAQEQQPGLLTEWRKIPYFDRQNNRFEQIVIDPSKNLNGLKSYLLSTLDSLSGRIQTDKQSDVDALKNKLNEATA